MIFFALLSAFFDSFGYRLRVIDCEKSGIVIDSVTRQGIRIFQKNENHLFLIKILNYPKNLFVLFIPARWISFMEIKAFLILKKFKEKMTEDRRRSPGN